MQVSALQKGNALGREGAAWAAASIAGDPANVGAFVQANVVPSLLKLLTTGARSYQLGVRSVLLAPILLYQGRPNGVLSLLRG